MFYELCNRIYGFDRFYSDRHEKEYKTENSRNRKGAVPGSQNC